MASEVTGTPEKVSGRIAVRRVRSRRPRRGAAVIAYNKRQSCVIAFPRTYLGESSSEPTASAREAGTVWALGVRSFLPSQSQHRWHLVDKKKKKKTRILEPSNNSPLFRTLCTVVSFNIKGIEGLVRRIENPRGISTLNTYMYNVVEK